MCKDPDTEAEELVEDETDALTLLLPELETLPLALCVTVGDAESRRDPVA